VDKDVAVITLNRPDKLNAFNRQMALALQSCLDDCADKSIRCIYITGAGKGFSAGQDLAEVTEPDGPGMAKILAEHYNPVITRLRNLPKPVVAAVNGVAAGAGANIALACDIVVAASGASFIQAFSKIGLIPDSGGTYFLPRLVGHHRAMALMMLGDKISAAEAERMGMIYKVFAEEEFAEKSLQLAHQLGAMATLGLAYTKLALNASAGNTLEQQLQMEDELQQKAAASNDFAEGVQAFLEKRIAIFKGN
jgi:2-(1,2-epoxy-1,2-dihydrophenyl)acetyl-CoA isomerase